MLLIVGLKPSASVTSTLPAVGNYIAILTKVLGAFQVVLGVVGLTVWIVDLI